jgi:hypothetical protein
MVVRGHWQLGRKRIGEVETSVTIKVQEESLLCILTISTVNTLVVILYFSFAKCYPMKNYVKDTWDLSILFFTTPYVSTYFSK